jgi:hypothetical protein
MAEILQGRKDLSSQSSAFVITNYTEDLAMDCNTAADAEICDVLATLIRELIKRGLISGTVA